MTDSFVARPGRRVEGELRVPGDKSISHRALLVAAIGHGEMSIVGLAPGADVRATVHALEALEVGVTFEPDSLLESSDPSMLDRDFQIVVQGRGWDAIRTPDAPIDVENSGTTIRLLLGLLAPSHAEALLTGDESIRRRPMGRVVEPLRRMGARIEGEGGGDRAPLRVIGSPLVGADHDLPVASAQVKSALLLAGLRARGVTTVLEPGRSRDHTERLLRHLGVQVDESFGRLIIKSTDISNAPVTIPGDLSSAAFSLVAAALLPGSEVVVREVGVNETRTGILDVLGAFGARVALEGVEERCGEPVGTVRVGAGERHPVHLSGELTLRTMDELPLVALLGTAAEGETVVRDAAELRVKESDRISALTTALAAMGADIEPLPDGFVVRGPARLSGARVDAAGDHRIAMALAVAGLAAAGETVVEGWGSAGVSYPGFERDLGRLVVR